MKTVTTIAGHALLAILLLHPVGVSAHGSGHGSVQGSVQGHSAEPARAAADRVFVPLGSENAIAVIDVREDRVVGRIGGVTNIHGLAATPDRRFLVAGSLDERTPGEALPPKPEGMSEAEHRSHHSAPAAGAPDSPGSESTLTILRTSDGAKVYAMSVPGSVHHVAVDPTGHYAVVTHPSRGGISAVHLHHGTVEAIVATGSVPNYAVFGRDGRSVFVSNAGDGTVSEIAVAGWRVLRSIPVGAGAAHMVLSRDGQRLYVNNADDGTVSELSLGENTVTRTFAVGSALHGMDLSDDGQTLFVADREDDRLAAVNLGTGAVRAVALGPSPYHVSVVRGADKLYVSSADEPKIWVLDAGTLELRGEIAIGGHGHQIAAAASL